MTRKGDILGDKLPHWVDADFAEQMHHEIAVQGHSLTTTRDTTILESALGRPQNAFYYGDTKNLFDIAALYTEAIAKNHPFIDANKRTAFLTAEIFLSRNGYTLDPKFSEKYVEALEAIASGQMTYKELSQLYEEAAIPYRHPNPQFVHIPSHGHEEQVEAEKAPQIPLKAGALLQSFECR